MNAGAPPVEPTQRRAPTASVDKVGIRRRELAEAALSAIAERGYANTGMRDIAQWSSLSHGSLHYYFSDKDDLVALAVWNYKAECARRYDPIVETAATGAELTERFGIAMAETLREEASLHRLWYDLRNQALFTEGFRETIVAIDALLESMVWMVLSRFAELEDRAIIVTPTLAYSLFDGLFQNALIRFLRGDLDAVDRLPREVVALMATALEREA